VPVVVIGVGNEFRRDDGAGLAVIERLRGLVPRGVGPASEHLEAPGNAAFVQLVRLPKVSCTLNSVPTASQR
jgi:hypothetical protein